MAFDAFGGGTSATETTLTVSGNGRGIAGNKNQYTESGAISVGSGSYLESGSVQVGKGGKLIAAGAYDLSKSKLNNLTVNNTGISGDQLAAITAQFAGNTSRTAAGSGTSVASNPANPNSTTTQTPATSTTTSETNTLKLFWQNLTTTQKYAAGALVLLLAWLIFFRKR